MEDDLMTEATDSIKPTQSGETTDLMTNEPAEQNTDNALNDRNNTPMVVEYMNETEKDTKEIEQELDTNAEMAEEMLTETQAMETSIDSGEQNKQQESMEPEITIVSGEPVKNSEEAVFDVKKELTEEQVTKCVTSEEIKTEEEKQLTGEQVTEHIPSEETVTEEKEQLTEEEVTTAKTSEETVTAKQEQLTKEEVTTTKTPEETVTREKEQLTEEQVTTAKTSEETVSEKQEQLTEEEFTTAKTSKETVTEEKEQLIEEQVTTSKTSEETVSEKQEQLTEEEVTTAKTSKETVTEAKEQLTEEQVTIAKTSEEKPSISNNLQSDIESSHFPGENYPPQHENAVSHESSPLLHKTSANTPSEGLLPPQKGPPTSYESTYLPQETSLPLPQESSLLQESSVPPEKETDNTELEQLTSQPQNEQAFSDNESLSNDAKVSERTEIKVNEEFKKLNQISSEETSNSSWYKMPENKEETMDVTETGLLGDENSNMSIPENASVVSSNIGENSVLSFQVDESSNLSIPDDGNSVPTFSGHQPVFDESANMNPPSNVTFIQPDTPGSVNADTMSEATPTSKRLRRGTLQIAAEDSKEHGHNITAADIYEYQWPQENDADWFILQEQISVYLDVKSFKRKYPEIFRRVCDKLEKDFLREKGVVTETQSDLGLTALKSEDVHDLMSRDYPAKYKEFLKILHDREKKRIAEKMKEYDAMLPVWAGLKLSIGKELTVHCKFVLLDLDDRLEKEKMVEYTKRAMKSASDWNRKMLKERSKERRAYFDMQTFAIHYPKGKFRKLQNIQTPQSSYPVSLIPGQFQEYYRKYAPGDLKHFPLNTTVFNPPKKVDPVARLQQQIVRRQKQQLAQPQSVTIQKNILERSVTEEPNKAGSGVGAYSDNESNSGNNSAGDDNKEKEKQDKQEGKPEDKAVDKLKKKEKSLSREASKEKSVEPIIIKKESIECRICKDEKDKSKVPVGEGLITCSECHRAGHPSCLDLTDSMVKVIKTYPWQCMECKTCVQCMDPYDEDKMLFCDNCDRGYHTFCVGLKSLPTGKWECKSCTGDTTPITPLPRPPPKSKRGRKPKDPNNPSTTPAKAQKDKDKDKENSVKPTPTRYIPRRESRTQENSKDAKETKETK